ncbi:MAG: hypothetical protein M0Z58_02085 [Nitrospiraceae bacterium]|nr:hypothetical protein [Nitrospiraceae bacterium]
MKVRELIKRLQEANDKLDGVTDVVVVPKLEIIGRCSFSLLVMNEGGQSVEIRLSSDED